MNPKLLREAAELAARMGYVFVATAGSSGRTHLAAARTLSVTPENQVRVSDWFCPETMQNLCANNFLSIVTWDPAADYGFQLLGELVDLKELGMMNGYLPELEEKPPLPQVEREMVVRVDKIIDFKIAPHSDVEE
jgi:hypothetical protein